jgi:hypothetical protein
MSVAALAPLDSLEGWKHGTGGFSVFAGVGERTREGNDLYREMHETVRLRLHLFFNILHLLDFLLRIENQS